jgi:hypothetical protein
VFSRRSVCRLGPDRTCGESHDNSDRHLNEAVQGDDPWRRSMRFEQHDCQRDAREAVGILQAEQRGENAKQEHGAGKDPPCMRKRTREQAAGSGSKERPMKRSRETCQVAPSVDCMITSVRIVGSIPVCQQSPHKPTKHRRAQATTWQERRRTTDVLYPTSTRRTPQIQQ